MGFSILSLILSEPVVRASPSASDFSLLQLVFSADFVVQGVMISLIMASIWSWTIIISKVIRFYRLRRMANQFEELFRSGTPLDMIYDRFCLHPREPFAYVFAIAVREIRKSMPKDRMSLEGRLALSRHIHEKVQNSAERQVEALSCRLSFLASLGSVGPFIGLFGTVWGIMHSFQAIAASQNTNLNVVAPAIAEALLATAIGLIAAIPAVIAYNKLSNDLNTYHSRLDGFINELTSIIWRKIEETR